MKSFITFYQILTGLKKEEIVAKYFSLLDDDDILKLYDIYKDDFLAFGYQGWELLSCSYGQQLSQWAEPAPDWSFTLDPPTRSQIGSLTQLLTLTTTQKLPLQFEYRDLKLNVPHGRHG